MGGGPKTAHPEELGFQDSNQGGPFRREPIPAMQKHRLGRQGAAGDQNSQRSGHLPNLLTPEEAARELRVSARTLANWRSQGTGPRYRKIGGRVVYPRRGMVDWTPEIKGFGNEKPTVTITIRPYHRDATRSTVDIMIQHPANDSIIRRRLTAPAGMNAVAAKVWGEGQVRGILRELFQDQDADDEKEDTKPSTRNKKTQTKTVGEYWLKFDRTYVANLKHASRLGFRGAWKHLEPIVQDLRLEEVDRAVFGQIKEASRAKGHAASTVNQIVSKMRRILLTAEADGTIAAGIVPKIAGEKLGHRKTKEVHSKADLKKLLQTAQAMGDDHHLLACMLVFLGLRIGECAGLYWADINFITNEVTIGRNMVKGIQQDSPKGEIGTLALHPTLRKALMAFPKGDSPRVLSWGDRVAELRTKTMQLAAGLPAFGPHRIRHSVITHLVEQGQDVYSVQAFARHSKIATTMEFYNHANRKNQAARAVDALDYGPEQIQVKKAPKGKAGTKLAPHGHKVQSERLSLN